MFQLREQLITDFSEYIQSFLKVRDRQIRDWVEAELDAGALWPEPLLSLNPSFLSLPFEVEASLAGSPFLPTKTLLLPLIRRSNAPSR